MSAEPEEKTRVLITTSPASDGFGDLYSAVRLKRLLEERHPDWDVQLYALRTIAEEDCPEITKKYIEYINKKCDEFGLKSPAEVIEFNPEIFIKIAGWSAGDHAKHERFWPPHSCKTIQLEIFLDEYVNVSDGEKKMMLEVSETEKNAMLSLSAIGDNLPPVIKNKIHTGNYFFAYGRSCIAEYIKQLIKAKTVTSEPIYVIVPGAKESKELETISNSVQYDINSGEIIKKTGVLEYDALEQLVDKGGDKVDVVIIRGVMPQNIFMNLLYNTNSPHVMVTGDMSLTEAFDAGKIPYLDWPAGKMVADLYGEYNSIFINFKQGHRPMSAAGMKLLADPKEVQKIKSYLISRYREKAQCENIISSAIDDYLSSKSKVDTKTIRRFFHP